MSSESPPPTPPTPPRPAAAPAPSTNDSVPPLSFSLPPFPPAPPAEKPSPPAPAPAAASPATAALPPELPKKTRRALIVGTTALVVLIATGFIWSFLRNRISDSELIAWLQTQSDARLTFTQLTKKVAQQSDDSRLITFSATGTTTTALYAREDSADHLNRTLGLSPASPGAVSEAAGFAADQRIRERAGISDTPSDLLETIVLRETASASTSIPVNGSVTAIRSDGQWHFAFVHDIPFAPAVEGRPRAAFGEKAYVIGNTDDDTALRQLVDAQNDAIARLKKAASDVASEDKRDRDSRLAHFLERLAIGALCVGSSATADGQSEPVSLEITSAKPSAHQVTLLLRNGGGWSDARPFSGSWTTDPATSTFTLTLKSRDNQAIANAGPIVGQNSALTITLTLNDEGRLISPADSEIPLNVALVEIEKLAAAKTGLTTRLDAALEATQPATIYHGTATAKAGGASEQIFLRFTRQSDNGASVAASFESAEPSTRWKRKLSGSVIDNSHRTGDSPLRFQMPGSGRTGNAKSGTLFAHASNTAPVFKFEGKNLTGEDDAFRYALLRISPAQAATLKKAVEANATALAASFPRNSGAYVEVDDQWISLPRNGGSTSGGLGGFAKGLFSKKDSGKPAVLVFKGNTPPPAVSGEDLTLTFKGKLPSRAKGVASDYPLLEAIRTTAQPDGTRTAPLERITSAFVGFGSARLTATAAQPLPDVLTLTFDQPLEPGTYAILVGTDGYEFTVK